MRNPAGVILAATNYWTYVKIFRDTRTVIEIDRFGFGQIELARLSAWLDAKGHKLVVASRNVVLIDHDPIVRDKHNQHIVDTGRQVLQITKSRFQPAAAL